MTTTAPKPTNEAYDRFRALAKQVINVPKAEADARAKLLTPRKPGRKPKP